MLLKGSKWWLSITIRKWSMSRLAHPAVKGAKTYEDGNSLRRNFILKQSLNFQPGPSHLHRISVETWVKISRRTVFVIASRFESLLSLICNALLYWRSWRAFLLNGCARQKTRTSSSRWAPGSRTTTRPPWEACLAWLRDSWPASHRPRSSSFRWSGKINIIYLYYLSRGIGSLFLIMMFGRFVCLSVCPHNFLIGW